MAEQRRLIRAAGAVVWASGPSGIRVALIRRPRYDDWTLPKGKCEPGEHVLATALREVQEETGLAVILGRPLGYSRYQRSGQPKRVDYWSACYREPPAPFVANDEVDELDWLSVDEAMTRLSYAHDRVILAEFAAGPRRTVPVILVRHASAGRQADWPGSDLSRPLDRDGAAEAAALAPLMAGFGAGRVISSLAERCVATVVPYAARTGAVVELEPLFTTFPAAKSAPVWPGEQTPPADQEKAAAGRASALAADGRPAVICAHGENLPALLRAVCGELGSPVPAAPHLRKGSFWVLHTADGKLVTAEQHRPVKP